MKRFILVLTILILSLGLIFSSVAAQERPEQYGGDDKEKSYLVGYKNVGEGHKKAESKGKVKKKYRHIPAAAVKMTPAKARELENDPDILFVEPDGTVEIKETYPHNLVQIKADVVHGSSVTGQGIKIALLDTGIDLNHQDLRVAGGVSFVEVSGGYQEQSVAEEVYSPAGQSVVDAVYSSGGVVVSSYMDDNGHGTHVAGVVAAQLNGIGVVGVSPGAGLYAVKVLDKDGIGSYSQIIEAIDWAIENGMNVVNMSFGGSQPSQALDQAMNNACDRGILLVAAAGNAGEGVQYPARYSSVIAVGAVDLSNKLASFSATGPELELVAPGVGVESTLPGNGYGIKSGTSVAAPHVAGAAALVWSAKPGLTNVQVRDTLKQGALPLGDAAQYGSGLVDVARSLGIQQQDNIPSASKEIIKINYYLQENRDMARMAAAQFISSEDSRVRNHAALVLGEIGELNDLPPLMIASDNDILENVRAQALVSVGKIYARKSVDERKKLSVLEYLLNSPHNLARDYAVCQLSRLDSDQARALAGQALTLETDPSRKSVLEAVYGKRDPGVTLSSLTYPKNSLEGLVSLLSYNRYGSGQTITAGQAATVSLQLSNSHSRVEVTVYKEGNPYNILDSRTYYSVPADGTVQHTWYTTTSTTSGTYVIHYHYPDNYIYDDFYDDDFYINVTASSPPPSPTDPYEPNDSIVDHRYNIRDIQPAVQYTAYIGKALDIDHFRFTPSRSGTLTFSMTGPSNVDFDAALVDSLGNGLTGSGGTSSNESFTYYVTGGSTYYIKIFGFGGYYSSSPYSFSISFTGPSGALDQYEPNNSMDNPTPLTPGIPYTAYIDYSGDEDFYSFVPSSSGLLTFSMTGPPQDYDVTLEDPYDLFTWSARPGSNESFTYSVTAGKTYYIRIYGCNGAFNSTSGYQFNTTFTPTVSRAKLGLSVTAPEVAGSGKTFRLTATIKNTSVVNASGVKTRIALPDSLQPVTGESTEKDLGQIAAGGYNTATWNVVAGSIPYSTGKNVTVTAWASNADQISQNITVAFLEMSVVSPHEATSGNSFKVEAKVFNKSSVKANNISANIKFPAGGLRVTDVQAAALLGPIAAGGQSSISWWVVPDDTTDIMTRTFLVDIYYGDDLIITTQEEVTINPAAPQLEIIVPQSLTLNEYGWYAQNPVPVEIRVINNSGVDYPAGSYLDLTIESPGGIIDISEREKRNTSSDPNLIRIRQLFSSDPIEDGSGPKSHTELIWVKPTYGRTITIEASVGALNATSLQGTASVYIPTARINPVVFVPGMYGSWPQSAGNNFVIDPLLRSYDNIIEQLKIVGYEEGVSLFTFPYDWLKSNLDNASSLGNKLADVRSNVIQSGRGYIDTGKVDIIAHSMGGILSRSYIQGVSYHNDVDQLITVGTPHRGAAKSYMALEGLMFDNNPAYQAAFNTIMRSIAYKRGFVAEVPLASGGTTIEVTEETLYNFVHSVPSAFELMPDYVSDPYLFSNGQPHPFGGYENSFLRNLNANDMSGLAQKLGSEKVTSIIGTGDSHTMGGFNVVRKNEGDIKWAYGEFVSPINNSGDGTVTENSAKLGSGMKNEKMGRSEDPDEEQTKHQKATTQFQPTIIKVLTGGRPVNNASFDSLSSLNDKTKILSYASKMCPAEFQLIDPQGRRVGFDPSTGNYVNEVPGAIYSPHRSEDWPEIIFIPDSLPGDWQVKVFPRGAGGQFSVELGTHFIDQKLTQKLFEVSGTISSGQQLQYPLKMSSQPDTSAPATQITVTGQQGSQGWYTGDVNFNLTASDDSSGVATTQYSLDGGASWQKYTVPVTLNSSGVYGIQYRSQDRAGNLEAPKNLEIKLDKTAPASGMSVAGPAGSDGWYRGEVTLTFTASDDVSGVNGIEYSLDGGLTWQGYTSLLTFKKEGVSAIIYRSRDQAGNVEANRTGEIKLDITPPVISGTATAQPNANGWYNTDVKIHFTASDTASGIASVTPDTVISSEGANRSVNGTATDKAGNNASFTVSGINIDKTRPTTTCTPDSPANANGWHNTDVQLTLTATDNTAGSGLAGTEYSFDGVTWNLYTSPVTVNTEGVTEFYYRSADTAGNTDQVNKSTVRIDKTPPSITGAATTAPNTNGWYNKDVTVHFTAYDELSGAETLTPDVTITTEGSGQTTTGTVVDKAGNTATFVVSGLNIDKTAPVISGAATTSPNANGWYNGDVIIHFAASDGLSGVESVTPDVTISNEGANQWVNGAAVDKASNIANFTVSGINIDKTAPATTASPATQPNSNGWYNSDVQVALAATDNPGGSGVAESQYSYDGVNWNSYSGPFTVTAEGIIDIYYRSSDRADNTELANKLNLQIDRTPPAITGAATAPANANGWYNTDVTVHFTANDELSGVETLTPDIIITTEGAGQTTTGTAVDKAGNSATFSVTGINIDKTTPVISGAATTSPNANGWYNTDVTVHFTTGDGLSGVESVTPDVTISNDGADQSVTGTVVDMAGNWSTFTVSGINLDKTAPAISGAATTTPNANGWYKGDVTVHFTAGDELSGVETVTPDVTITTEGANQSVTGTAADKAGNIASVTVGNINIDKTLPEITINVPASGGEYLLNANVPADWTSGDALSGLASSSGTVPSDEAIDTASVGAKIFTVNAGDNAGNSEAKTHTYYVRYTYSGVMKPINQDGSSVIKGNVPVKFQITDANGSFVNNATARLYLARVTSEVPGAEIEATSTGKANEVNLFRFDSTDNQYIFNLNTKDLVPGTWRLRIALDDGTSKYVTIGLK